MDFEYVDAAGNRKKGSFSDESAANRFAQRTGYELSPVMEKSSSSKKKVSSSSSSKPVSSSSVETGPAPADSVPARTGLIPGEKTFDDTQAMKRYPTMGSSAMGQQGYTDEIAGWKDGALQILKGLYKGDFNAFMYAVAAGKKPKLDDAGNKQDFYNAVKTVLSIDPSSPAQLQSVYDIKDNKYLDIVRTNSELKAFHQTPKAELMPSLSAAKAKDGGVIEQGAAAASDLPGIPGRVASNVGSTLERVLFPNYALRKMTGEGTFSRGVGALSDILGLIPRVATATVEGVLPTSTGTTWSERVGRPDPFSTAPERAVDFTVSGMIPGKILTKGAGSLAAKASTYKKTPQIIKDITRGEDAQSAVLGPYLQGAQVQRSYPSRALAGAGEGVAYSAMPALTIATNPEQTNPDKGTEALATLAAGGVLGAGVATAGKYISNKLSPKKPEELSNWGQELLGGHGSLARLGAASANPREPLTSSIQGVEQIAGIKSGLSNLLDKLGQERKDILATSISPVVSPFENFGVLSSKSVSPKQQRYINAILTKLTRDYAKDHNNPTLEELIQMRTAAGKIVANTKGTEEALPAAKVFGYIKDQMELLAGKTRTLHDIPERGVMTAEQKASAEAFRQEQIDAAQAEVTRDKSMWVGGDGKKFDPNTAPKEITIGWPIAEMDKDHAEYQMRESLANLARATNAPLAPVSSVSIKPALQKNYEKFAQVLKEQEEWALGGEKVESTLSKLAQSRLDPLTRAASFKDAAESMQGILDLFTSYNVPKFNAKGEVVPGVWKLDDVDYLTPAVMREVRKRIKGEDSGTFRMLARRLVNAVAPVASTSIGGTLATTAAKAPLRGSWAGTPFTTENSRTTYDPTTVDLVDSTSAKKKQ